MKNKSKLEKLSESFGRLYTAKRSEAPLEILTAFVKDTEHEVLTVITALQAQIDLLHNEQRKSNVPLENFTVINRNISRLVADTTTLGRVSEFSKAPRSSERQVLEKLVRAVAEETRAAFEDSNVTLVCKIVKGTMLVGNDRSLKLVIKELLLAVLRKCHQLEVVQLTGYTHKKEVSIMCEICSDNYDNEFTLWQLGHLHLVPLNGEGISLSAVDAIARMNKGHLGVRSSSEKRNGYKLSFKL